MKKIRLLSIIASIFFVASCITSDTDDLAIDVRLDIIDYIRSNGDYDTEVKSLVLTKVSENNYSGILTTIEYGSLYTYDVIVTTDGDFFSWEILDESSASEFKQELAFEELEEDYVEDSYPDQAELGWDDDYSNKSSSDSKSYCNLSANTFFEFLTSNDFTLNGNGSVKFSRRYDFSSEQFVEGDLSISGNGNTLTGKYEVLNGSTIYISDLFVISGYFDASNNRGSSGVATINCNGDLSGNLTDGNNTIDLNILLID